jgi:uncharacterized membrane protein
MILNILPNFLVPVMILVYLIIPAVIIYFIYKWENLSLKLKQDQNDLLREIVQKMNRNE